MTGATLDRAIDDALALVGLADRARDKVASFSGGMKRRLNIAGALLHDPELLLFDEPTVGVDPQSRNAIFDNLAELKRRGKTLVYTTHYMEEAERLCDRIVIVDHGKVLADDTLPRLLARAEVASRLQVDLAAPPPPALAATLGTLPGVHGVIIDDARLDLGVEDLSRATPPILDALAAAGCIVRALASDRANLESVFLTLTGRSLRD
jgi:ABC-2 type transport system ATP-binding protein